MMTRIRIVLSTATALAAIACLLPAASGFSPGTSTPTARSARATSKSRTVMATATALSSCVAQEARSLDLFSTTPLVRSAPLSELCHPHPVYLKLDLLQRSGSFKDRGMAHLCATVRRVHEVNLRQKREQQRGENGATDDGGGGTRMRVISSSGGNAGLAVTTVARDVPGMDVSVVVPETTKPMVVGKLRSLRAEVTVHGANWNEADALARRWVEVAKEEGGGAVYVSPFDNPLLWTGHSTVIDEIITQLSESPSSANLKMGAILASVGGGGLICGIFEGIERNYFSGNQIRSNIVSGTKVVACETEGAASFAASFNASSNKEVSMVRLDDITSVATSLGALEVTPVAIERSHRHQERGDIGGAGDDVLSLVCTDAEAVDACVRFAADHRMLVEPACGASLAALYTERLRSGLLEALGGDAESAIVVEVCGGSGVDLDLLGGWRARYLG